MRFRTGAIFRMPIIADVVSMPDIMAPVFTPDGARLSWAKLIRRVYEVDPLLCPFCGAEMRILAFILDFAAAKAIRKSLKLPDQEPEPLAHAPPRTLELVAESV